MNANYIRICRKINKRLLKKDLKGRHLIYHIRNKGCLVAIGDGHGNYSLGWSMVHKGLDRYSRRVGLTKALLRSLEGEDLADLPFSLYPYLSKFVARAEKFFQISENNRVNGYIVKALEDMKKGGITCITIEKVRRFAVRNAIQNLTLEYEKEN